MNTPKPPHQKKSKNITKAVAIQYDSSKQQAPIVSAKGAGSVADRIIEIARANNITIHQDSDMIEILSRVDVGEEIPEYLYKAIAEILAHIYRLNREFGQHSPATTS